MYILQKQKNTAMNRFKKEFYSKYIDVFLMENSKVNLISKNDEKFLWEKHIFDSLSLSMFFDKYMKDVDGITLLDIGTGGGFPAIPIALSYPKLNVFALDSISKKLRAIENIKLSLGIKNLTTVNDRAENLKEKFDVVTSRAVGKLEKISAYALPLTKKNGYFVAFKSKSVNEEIENATKTIKKFGGEITEIIPYTLPTSEAHERNLVVVKKIF